MILDIAKRWYPVPNLLINGTGELLRRDPNTSMPLRVTFFPNIVYDCLKHHPLKYMIQSSAGRSIRDATVSVQSGVMTHPSSLPAVFIYTVKEYGQAKNRWSLVSFFSPQSIQHCSIPQLFILSPIVSRSLNASQTIKACRGTSWGNQANFLHTTSVLLSRR